MQLLSELAFSFGHDDKLTAPNILSIYSKIHIPLISSVYPRLSAARFYLTYASPSRMKTLVDIFEERDIDMSIYLRSRYIGVPEKFLNSADVGAALKKM